MPRAVPGVSPGTNQVCAGSARDLSTARRTRSDIGGPSGSSARITACETRSMP